mmetsp:Transcript_37786/g.121478  ORF Transcript_37786/g.121478 Transcript_37786/m.121478 type:complete len:225 (+) Transcript_37786:1761-2435(+)
MPRPARGHWSLPGRTPPHARRCFSPPRTPLVPHLACLSLLVVEPDILRQPLNRHELRLNACRAHHQVHGGALQPRRLQQHQPNVRHWQPAGVVEQDTTGRRAGVQPAPRLGGERLRPLLHRLVAYRRPRHVRHARRVGQLPCPSRSVGRDRLAACQRVGVVRVDGRMCGGTQTAGVAGGTADAGVDERVGERERREHQAERRGQGQHQHELSYHSERLSCDGEE